jgi:hypothetical protein
MKYQPPFGSSDPNEPYVDRNLASGIQGSRVAAKAIEHHLRELHALIEKSGLTPSESDLVQVLKAVRSQALNYRTAGGTANALTISLDPAPSALSELVGVPLRLITAAPNTGAATLKVGALAATPIVNNNSGGALTGGELRTGKMVEVIYDGTAFRLLTPALEMFLQSGSFGPSGSLGAVGTTNWTVPTGVTRVRVRCWGAGGGGGGSQASPSAAAGGGAGAYVEGVYSVTPGQVIAVTAGAPGTGGGSNTAANGVTGGSSSFGAFCSATGGVGGGGASTGGYQAAAGAGGAPTGGNVLNLVGTGGMSGFNVGSTGLGGGGGSAFACAGSHPQLGGAGVGFPIAAGGGGGANAGGGATGGAGLVIVEW